MKYLMLVRTDEAAERPPELIATIGADVEAWVDEMDRRGVHIEGHVLTSPQDATTIRVRGGEMLVADGPFAETKEQVGGFDILECADLDEAMEVAAKHPVARFGALELRPYAEE